MKKTLLIQLGILTLIIIIAFFTYNYLNKEKKAVEKIDKKTKIKGNKSNKIEDLKYKSSDKNGNIYEILSKSGTIDDKNQNLLILENVNAKIIIKKFDTIYIYADYAKYNKINLNTHFYKNLNLKYIDHNIESDDIFLDYIKKEVKIANNVNYFDKNNRLNADIIELDLITKISKIYMIDEGKKIKALIKN